MKTAIQIFIETKSEQIQKLDCELLKKIKDLMQVEKECVIGAYEAGLMAAKHNWGFDASEYFNRFYSDPNEDSNARIDMQFSTEPRRNKKRKRKSAP